jgi:hypothetical protein
MIGCTSALTLQDDVPFGRSAGAPSHVDGDCTVMNSPRRRVTEQGDASGVPAGDEATGSARGCSCQEGVVG